MPIVEKLRAVAFRALLPYMDAASQAEALRLVPRAKTVLCGTFPYFAGREKGNISKYARGRDYHEVVGELLEKACRELEARYGAAYTFVPLADRSPLPEVTAAALAGLGVAGRHGLLITPEHGSYVFIGCILTDLDLRCETAELAACENCGRCAEACPGGALGTPEGERHFDAANCVSFITQKKGALEPRERELLRRSGCVWGCDACQDACPRNRDAAPTDIAAFRDDLICSLGTGDVEGLSNRELKEKYPSRAFTWRGAATLLRNCEVLIKKD